MKEVNFIPCEVILIIQREIIQLYGGIPGLRDRDLLESAMEQPKTSYDGVFLHETIFEMAAAYGFYLSQKHPFFDGNKRISLIAMDIFLQENGYEIVASEKELFKLMVSLSEGNIAKKELSVWIKANSQQL